MSETNKFSTEELSQIIKGLDYKDQARIAEQVINSPDLIKRITIDLGKKPTNPKKLGFAFKSVYVFQATDNSVEVNMRLFTDTQSNDVLPLRRKDVLSFDYPVNNALIDYDVQAGKEVTLIFILNGTFDSGSSISETTSGVATTFSELPNVAMNDTINEVVAENTERESVTLTNRGANDVWLGTNAVTAGTGYLLSVGEKKTFQNSAQIFGICATGESADIAIMEEE